MEKKQPITISLSLEAHKILKHLSLSWALSRGAIMEILLRRVNVLSSPSTEQSEPSDPIITLTATDELYRKLYKKYPPQYAKTPQGENAS